VTRPLLVMGSPPTANGDLHLGHLAGPYLGADVFTRYQRMKGREVWFTTGSDDHQSYVVRKGEALGLQPEETAGMFSGRIKETLRLAAIEPDVFTPSHSSPIYRAFVTSFFKNLWDQGRLEVKEAPLLYCPSCDRNLFGADVRGLCAHCSEPCDGALCESCGRPVSAGSLKAPECGRCGGSAQVKPVQQLLFRLQDFAPELRRYHEKPRLRPHSHAAIQAMLDGGLGEISVGHPGDWGIAVPVLGFEDQQLDVWAEVGPGYLATTQELTANHGDPSGWERFWCDDQAEVVQFFGFDNTFAHTVLHPALLMAHGGFRPPDSFVINEFHQLDGSKFSSSRGHAVWGGEILQRVPSDLIRYYLCFTAPERSQENFTLDEFQQKTNRNLGGVVQRAIDRLYSALCSRTPAEISRGETSAPSANPLDPLTKVTLAAEVMGQALEAETFSLRRAVRIWRNMVVHLDGYWRETETAESRDGAGSTWSQRLGRASAALTVVASCAYPLMPEFAQRLWNALGIEHDIKTHKWGEPAPLQAGSPIEPVAEPWFPEISDNQLTGLHPMAKASI
jgi:methionyl-tRNA synthetase